MKKHTSIHIGGPAEIFTIPKNLQEIQAILEICTKKSISLFILGGGSNILVSDKGIPGIVMSMNAFTHMEIVQETEQTLLHCETGSSVSSAALFAAEQGFAGIDFLYSMPGSVGGAVWMNARCYGQEISQVLESVRYLTYDGTLHEYHCDKQDFSYKKSPFQQQNNVLLSCTIRLQADDKERIQERMLSYRKDREKKGHFIAPSAGSVFKNDPQNGAPSGVLIDRLNMRGKRRGDAQISDLHANILINRGSASAADVLALVEEVEQNIFRDQSIRLEREILLVGNWTSEDREK